MLASGIDLNKVRLGDQVTVETIHAQELLMLSHKLVSEAVRQIDIYSRDLDPPLYDSSDFLACVRSLCISQRRSRLRVLVQEPARILRHGHGLLRLAQRLPSYIEIRQPAPEHHTNNFALMVVDAIGSIYREMGDRYEATVHFGDRKRARALSEQFESIWHTAAQPPDLRRLSL